MDTVKWGRDIKSINKIVAFICAKLKKRAVKKAISLTIAFRKVKISGNKLKRK